MQDIPIPLKTLRQVAADADVAEKTAAKVVLGLPVRPGGRERVLAALAARGIDVEKLGAGQIGTILAGARVTTTNPTGGTE